MTSGVRELDALYVMLRYRAGTTPCVALRYPAYSKLQMEKIVGPADKETAT